MKRIITTFLLLIAPAAVGASELPARILIGTIATTEDTKSVSDATAYVISRVMAALTNRLGISRPLEIVPYARALTESRLHSNVIIAPLARTQRREAHYRWLIPLFDDELHDDIYDDRLTTTKMAGA